MTAYKRNSIHFIQLVLVKVKANLQAEASKFYLSYVWWIFEPLLQIIVFYVVFGLLLERGTDNFVVYLLTGIIPWLWFNRSISNSAFSIVQGRGIMMQVNLSKLFFPTVVICQDLAKQFFVMILLITFLLLYGIEPALCWLTLPLLMCVQLLFIAVAAYFVAAVIPFLPDLNYLVRTGLMMLMFCSGVFYSVEAISKDCHMSVSSPLISIHNVGVKFRLHRSIFATQYFEALKNVSFSINRGDSFGIIGRNGAGKTTMLRLLAGILQPDTGKIKNRAANTAILALQVGFDPELTGRANAILSGMLLGVTKKEVERQLDNIIAFSELGDFIDRPVKSYSSGMKARLGFAVALQVSPEILLIDEVLGVGDVSFQKKSIAVMKEKLLSDQTIVLVSHDRNTVKTLCNRAVWIENGVSLMEGDSEEVVAAYEEFLTSNLTHR